jgi:hypothetical protein
MGHNRTITPAPHPRGARSGVAPTGPAAPIIPGCADVCTALGAPPFTAHPIRDELQRALAIARGRKCRA